MKSFNSVLLCLVYGIVLVLGGVIFKYLEYYEEDFVEVTEPPEWTHLKGKRQGSAQPTTGADFRINSEGEVFDVCLLISSLLSFSCWSERYYFNFFFILALIFSSFLFYPCCSVFFLSFLSFLPFYFTFPGLLTHNGIFFFLYSSFCSFFYSSFQYYKHDSLATLKLENMYF